VSANIYVDTSALAKWYLNESHSEDVEKYIQENGPVSISDLTVVEMRSLLARRRRDRSLDSKMEIEVFATFQEDIRLQYLICHPFSEGLAAGAVNLLSRLPDIPIRTLDALHLTIAKDHGADVIVTADRIMAGAGQALGFSVVKF
jgi:predicted nucleic acid-binding protein